MRISQVILISLFSLSAFAESSSPKPIGFEKEYSKKFMGEQYPQKIKYSVTGTSIENPFIWSVSVFNQGIEVYKLEKNDAWLNENFASEGYITSCNSFAACKEKWYYKDLPVMVEEAFTYIKIGETPLEEWKVHSIESEVTGFLVHRNFSKVEINRVIKEIKTLVSTGGYAQITLPFSPVQMESTLIYVPSIKEFVPYLHQ